jgi:hypothetical protein
VLLLLSAEDLDLADQGLGSHELLIEHLASDTLVIEALVVVLGVDLSPNPVPFSQSPFPLLVLVLESGENDGHSDAWVFVERSDHLATLFATVDLLDNRLIHALCLPAEARLETEVCFLLEVHLVDAVGDRFEERDCTKIGFDEEIVLMTFLFRAMEGLLERILAVSQEALFGPSRTRNHGVVEDLPTKSVPARTGRLSNLDVKTFSDAVYVT